LSNGVQFESTDFNVGQPVGAIDRVVQEILSALEQRRLVPGQRLIETEIALSLGVGRNAVREAIQRLAAKGIIDLSRNRSPSIRQLDLGETMEVLEVAEEMLALAGRLAARGFVTRLHGIRLREISSRLEECKRGTDRASFSELRRNFYRVLLEVGANRELCRHFATIQMQIIYAQFESSELVDTRIADYQAICDAVRTGDVKAAEAVARAHVKHVRRIIQKLAPTQVGRL
jgi:DNA-binding GntR family transcriptional regulator